MLRYLKTVLPLLLILLAAMPATTLAIPTANYYKQGGEIFDDWDLCRTHAAGADGFFQAYSHDDFYPAIVAESLGENADRAYQTGQEFAQKYPDSCQRAEQIFAFARDRVRYTSDANQFGFPEFAQNADELADSISDDGLAYGDCEDYAALLAVMFKGAGLRCAIVLAPEHTAALVYLPEYSKTNRPLSIEGETGWVWAEATGGNNPLGWMPERFMNARLGAYEVEDVALEAGAPPDKPTTVITSSGGGSAGLHFPPFFGILGLMWLLSLFRRRH